MRTQLGIAGLIGLGSIAAAAGGGYLALRSNAADLSPTPATEAAPPVAQPARAATPADIAGPAMVRATTVDVPAAPISTVPTKGQATPAPMVMTSAPAQAESDSTSTVSSAETPATANAVSPAAVPVAAPTPTPAPPTAPSQVTTPVTRYDEVTLAADSVLGLQIESNVSTRTAHVEDRVDARLSRDVLVGGRVAIAAGARLEGAVTLVERGGKYKNRPRLGITFSTLVLADGTRMAIQTEPIYRDGDSPAGQATAKVGGSAVVGAILGAMIGGKKGAAIGTAAGAAGGAAAVAAGDRNEASLPSGTPVTARLSAPVIVLIERDHK